MSAVKRSATRAAVVAALAVVAMTFAGCQRDVHLLRVASYQVVSEVELIVDVSIEGCGKPGNPGVEETETAVLVSIEIEKDPNCRTISPITFNVPMTLRQPLGDREVRTPGQVPASSRP